MATLKKVGYVTLITTDPGFVRKAFRKARMYQRALRGGADAFDMHKRVAVVKKERYASHRRPAPSQYDAM